MTAEGAARVANDVSDFRYRARLRVVPPGAHLCGTVNAVAETQILIAHGTLNMMVNGLGSSLGPGQFVRVSAETVFGWRNDTGEAVTLLIHSVSPSALCPILRLAVQVSQQESRAPASP